MRQAEKALADFKASYGGQLSDAESSYNNQLSSLTAELDEKQITFGENGRKKAVLEQELAEMQPMSITEQISLGSIAAGKRGCRTCWPSATASWPPGETPQHPDVVALDSRISRNLQISSARMRMRRRIKHNTQIKLAENPQYQP